ncbi:MAG: hypothetical protein AAB380_08090, partial [Verrucomicrobiota bacterium]
MQEKQIPISNRRKRDKAKSGARISSHQIVACALLLCGATASAARVDAIEIVRDGCALAVIVLKPGAHAMEQEAADDLRWAVREATGVTLDVVSEA